MMDSGSAAHRHSVSKTRVNALMALRSIRGMRHRPRGDHPKSLLCTTNKIPAHLAGFGRSADQFVIVGMRADPEPEITAVDVDGQGSITQANPDGPVASDLLELQRWMPRIALESLVVRVGQFSNRGR
jgi:hypothetical protein